MPKPLPDYTPPEIAADIVRLNKEGIKIKGLCDYSLYKGLTRNRLIHLFSSDRHPQLLPYFELSRFAGIPLDDLVQVVKDGQFSAFIDRLLWSKQIRTIAELEREANLGRDVIRNRVNGYDGSIVISEYAEAAEKLGWSTEKLAKYIFRNRIYTNAS